MFCYNYILGGSGHQPGDPLPHAWSGAQLECRSWGQGKIHLYFYMKGISCAKVSYGPLIEKKKLTCFLLLNNF
jgi:hypothetical protein